MRVSIEEARRLKCAPNFLRGKNKSKYRNQKVTYNGFEYDSKKEAKRAADLDLLIKAGEVESWERQPSFDFVLNGQKICTYIADFRVTYPDGAVEIEDVKGVKTAVYRIKKKMMKAFYGIDVKEL